MQRRTDETRDLAHDDGYAGDAGVPLVIDGDSTLSHASLLINALLVYLKPAPFLIVRALGWLLRGRRHLERKLVEAGVASQLVLPIDPGLAAFAVRAAAKGRALHLTTARRSPLLEEVAARQSMLVDTSDAAPPCGEAGVVDHAAGRRGVVEVVRRGMPPDGAGGSGRGPEATLLAARFTKPSVLRELRRGLRPHQCVKNFIVFVPLILGGHLADLADLQRTLLAFVALTLVASGTYLINDVWDVADDRKHWSKRDRPIASGRLSIATALAAALPIIGLGMTLGMLVSPRTAAMLLVYLGVTLAYTLHIKTVPFLDGLVLAALFTIRLGIGAVAAEVPPSPWLFVFSMFLFSSLCYAKRYTEIAKVIARQDKTINGRGYRAIDAPIVLTAGLASGIGAVLIMVLYIVEEAFRSSFYGSTGWLWGFPPLMFLFIMRIWLVSGRGEMSDDPVAFAIRDRASLAVLALLSVCFAFAWLG